MKYDKQVVHEVFGIAEGLMTTVHATTGLSPPPLLPKQIKGKEKNIMDDNFLFFLQLLKKLLMGPQ